MSSGPAALAVDIGGTKLAAGVVERTGRIVRADRRPTPRGSAEVVFAAVAALVRDVRREAGVEVDRCGVGCGGPMAAGGLHVSPINIPGWRRFPLLSRLEEETGLPTVIDNDVKALALAEAWMGSARGRADFLAMVVSTGVGGGIVSGGRLLQGATGNAGHIGHVIVEPEGRICGCGARGCLEAQASGIAIEAVTGRPPAEAGPAVVERCGTLVGRAVAMAANLLDLRLAVVGGSVALGFGPPFFAAAQAELDSRARLDFSTGAQILPSDLGAQGGILGAAALAFSQDGHGPSEPVGGAGPATSRLGGGTGP